MTSKFWVEPRVVNSALGNGRTNPTLLKPVSPGNLISGATDEWRFGLAAWSLTGIVNLTQMIVHNNVPTFNRNTMILSSGNQQGVYGVNEMSAETHCFIFNNITPNATEMMAGTMTSNTANGGWGIYRQGTLTNLQFLTRGITNTAGTNAITTVSLSSIPIGMAFFVAISHSETTRLAYVGGVSNVTSSAGTHIVSIAPLRQVSIGNVWYTNSYSQQTQALAYVAIPSTQTVSQINGIYATMKAMMRLRGVNVF